MVKYDHSLSKKLTIKVNKDFSPVFNNCYQYYLLGFILPIIRLTVIFTKGFTESNVLLIYIYFIGLFPRKHRCWRYSVAGKLTEKFRVPICNSQTTHL